MPPRRRRRPFVLAFALAQATIVWASLASGCAPSVAEARRAERAVYETEFSRVWNAVADTVKDLYPNLAVEDPVQGKMVTQWHLVERVEEEGVERPTGVHSGAGAIGKPTQPGQPTVTAGKFFRITVVIRPGGPPWRLEIDGEAALFQPGMAMITPYDHSDADEPSWVKPRIDKVRVGIYRRLAGYARVVEPAPGRGPEVLDKGPWANLPKGAPDVVAAVNAAARKKDSAALRRFMSDDFTWSTGGTPSADAALSMWNADPLLLAALVKTLEAGCSERETDVLIACPARGAGNPGTWRAEFRKQGDAWRFAAFYQEE